MRKLSTPLSSLAGCVHRGWRADLGRRRLILHAGGCGSDNKAVGGAATSSCGTAHPTRLRCRHVVRQLCSIAAAPDRVARRPPRGEARLSRPCFAHRRVGEGGGRGVAVGSAVDSPKEGTPEPAEVGGMRRRPRGGDLIGTRWLWRPRRRRGPLVAGGVRRREIG
jgi:hypothetical protein